MYASNDYLSVLDAIQSVSFDRQLLFRTIFIYVKILRSSTDIALFSRNTKHIAYVP